jgi:LacI family transcriptional regulator
METKKITIQDIAEHANVSKSTVSRVLNNTTPVNEEKRQAVLKAVEELDFEPNSMASGLAGGNSMTIGIQTQKIGSPFYDLVTRGIINALTGTRYSPILVDGFWDKELELKGIETLLRRQVDGLIIVGGDIEKEKLEQLAEKTPILLVGREVEGLQDRCMFIDNFDIGYRATKFLIDLGHREIVHITGIMSHQDSIRRFEGYQRALKEAGIPFDPELVCEGSFDGPSGAEAIENLIANKKKFTAVFAANDMSAFGARLAMYRHDIRVPSDVSLIGVDDQVEAPYMTPPLTSVRQPAFEMGSAVGKAMVDMLGRREFSFPQPSIEISVRESTAPIS